MLELRPTCENCNIRLPADSTQAMICTYECTFCRSCVENVLKNVCPNCGGGFSPRPLMPKNESREGVSITHQPPSTCVLYKSVDCDEHEKFADVIKTIPLEER